VGNAGERSARPLARATKRALDVVGASLGLLLSIPILAVAMLAIAIESHGPVLFHQTRVGRGGRPFRLHKLRTMQAGNDEDEHGAYVAALIDGRAARHGDLFKIRDDPRCTRVGRLLRETSIDELPQLWNVLRGDMSLVGPRPLIASEDERIRGYARMRLHLAPGMTGLWQVLGRTTIPFEEMVKLDFIYISNWSLWTDIKLLLRTIPAVVVRRGAN
jgi:lipopolysaccharide/colanic/teichoic acid biosynthesis glycosyltransferase